MKTIGKMMLAGAIATMGMGAANAQTIKFGKDHKLKIVQITDVHWRSGDARSHEAAECINEVLDAEKPDLVLYTGDLAFGKPAFEALDSAFTPAVKRNIPFGYTFGNHDDEQDKTRQELYEYTCKFKGNLTSTVPGISGVANFYIPIKSSDGKKDAAMIYVFDSNSYSPIKEIKGYDWVKPDQIAWYNALSKKYKEANGGVPLPSIVFQHIPVPEYNIASSDEDTKMIGKRYEPACAPKINTGEFANMLLNGDVMAMFVGHDHVNNYLALYKGIVLGYGQYSGGHTVYCPANNGARVIELTEGSREFTTWIRMRGGDIVDKVVCPSGIQVE